MTPPRSRLLERLFASEPRLISLAAPAGYGKSSLARLYARRFERHAICDCVGVADAKDFAGRAMSALAGESQAGGDSIALTRLRLHASEADAAAWSRGLLEAWKLHLDHSIFILDHAEAIAQNTSVLALLGDLLAARPPERVILISARATLPLRVSHYLAPHQILALSSEELRFDADEIRSAFDGIDVAPEALERIARLTDGWPTVLLLIALFARYDANLDQLIDKLSDVPRPNLHDFLANELLSAFTPDMMATMLAAAAIPNASLEDITAATGIRHATPVVDRLLHLPGFLSSEAGTYQTHPLLLRALRARHAVDLTNYLIRAAREHESNGDFLRAAELYDAYGDEHAAAAALDRLQPAVLAQLPNRLIDNLVKIRISTLYSYPNLWIAMLPYRRQNVDASRLYDEGVRLLQSIASDAPPSLQRSLRVRLATLAHELERLAEARTLLESADRSGSFEEPPEERRLALMTAAIVAAKQGRFARSDAFVDESDAVAGARHLRFETERAAIAVERARFLGEWLELLKLSEEALYSVQGCGVTSRIVGAARAVAWAAWYCNDDARVTSANQMLEDCGDAAVRAFARYVEAALARRVVDAPPSALQVARWHAAMATTDVDLATELFDQAIDGIDAVENDFLRIAIRVGAALLLPVQRRRLLEARAIAQEIESPSLQASLELLIDSPEPSDYGIFKYIAARIARSPLKQRREILRVEVVHGQVRRGTQTLHVSDRGLELLVALALLPAGMPKEDLAKGIWPGLDSEAALNTLKMCVSRTRAQVADKEAIASAKRGYALSDRVTVDVREYERLLRGARGVEMLSDPARRQVQDAIRALDHRELGYTASWAWFAPHGAHLDELRHDLSLLLVKDAWRRDGPATSLQGVPSSVSTGSS
jgi:hypothetical protein